MVGSFLTHHFLTPGPGVFLPAPETGPLNSTWLARIIRLSTFSDANFSASLPSFYVYTPPPAIFLDASSYRNKAVCPSVHYAMVELVQATEGV